MHHSVSHYVGVDLGKPSEFTALAVLEGPKRGCGTQDVGPPVYSLRHLHRWSPGTGYPEIVADVVALAGGCPLHGEATVLVDQTGVGRAIMDLFRRAPVPGRLVPVAITGGTGASFDGVHYVSKVELIAVALVLLQTHRLKIARGMPDIDLLVKELDRYREDGIAQSGDPFAAWRDGSGDDLVLALALACWQAERQPPMRAPEWIGPPRPRGNFQARLMEMARSRPRRGLFGQRNTW